jgi:hypothetical protein
MKTYEEMKSKEINIILSLIKEKYLLELNNLDLADLKSYTIRLWNELHNDMNS